MNRKLVVTGMISVSALAFVAFAPVAEAKSGTPVVANAQLNCSTVVGKISFSPKLTATGTSKGTLKYVPSHCTFSKATNLPANEAMKSALDKATSFSANGTDPIGASTAGPATITNTWKGSPAALSPSTLTVTLAGLTNTGASSLFDIFVDVNVSGSFGGTGTVTLQPSITWGAFENLLTHGGVKSLTIKSGSVVVGLPAGT